MLGLFSKCKTYCSGLKDRFQKAPWALRTMATLGPAGGLYTAIRAAFVSIKIPLIGEEDHVQIPLKVLIGALVGLYEFSSIGNRLGEMLDAYLIDKDREPIKNRLFLLRTIPWIFGALADVAIACFNDYADKSIFELTELSPAEVYIIATLYGLYIGATVATREGRIFDLYTDTLWTDLGFTRFLSWIKERCQKAPERISLLSHKHNAGLEAGTSDRAQNNDDQGDGRVRRSSSTIPLRVSQSLGSNV